jgi:hypothetical protein
VLGRGQTTFLGLQAIKNSRGVPTGDLLHSADDLDSGIGLAIVAKYKRFLMVALAEVLSRATGIAIDVETLQRILLFCGAGLLFSFLLIINGFDLAAAFY